MPTINQPNFMKQPNNKKLSKSRGASQGIRSTALLGSESSVTTTHNSGTPEHMVRLFAGFGCFAEILLNAIVTGIIVSEDFR